MIAFNSQYEQFTKKLHKRGLLSIFQHTNVKAGKNIRIFFSPLPGWQPAEELQAKIYEF
jgi:hypothetical protein